jgi:hypothetical protein
MTVKDEVERMRPVVDRVNDAIRDNPLAAGLIGAGVAWMLFGGAKGFSGMAQAAQGAAITAGGVLSSAGAAAADGVMAAGSQAVKAGRTAASEAAEAASKIAGSVASIVPDMSDTGTDYYDGATPQSAVSGRIGSAAATGREYGAAIQSRLSESLERQPLLLGAIGLAIGAGVASTFSTTKIEGELVGEHGTAAREKLQGLAQEAKQRAEQVVSDVREEANRQGLTPEAVKNAAANIGEKVKSVAEAGRDAATHRGTRN